jgi:uncharacterized protein YqhQ
MTRPLYGGQAVLEGVMMRGQRHAAVAVRHPKGHIVTRAEALPHRLHGGLIGKLPFVRGMVLLWDAMTLGTRALAFSAQVAAADEEDAVEPEDLPSAPSVRGTMLSTLAFAIGLFFVTPMLITGVFYDQIGAAALASLVEGLLRLLLMVGYLWLIGSSPRFGRVFAYHGAEHKTVHAQERGLELETAPVQSCSTAHPRCGTALLLVVIALSIVVFALLGHPPLWLRILSRILLVPVLIGLAYEWLRFSAKHFQLFFIRALVWPGLLLQSLTTREPDDEQVAVAIAALRAVMAADDEAKEPTPVGALETA